MPFEGVLKKTESASPNLERLLAEKITFQDIDVEQPENAYHQDMVKGLLTKNERGVSLIRQVLQARGRKREAIERVLVERIVADDISRGVGEKRNVDRFTFQFADGTEELFTVSLDIDPHRKEHESASLAEARVLQAATRLPPGESVIQEYYGTGIVKDREGKRALICKEYLPGRMLREVLADPEGLTAEETRDIANAVGHCFGAALVELGGAPVDTHAANIIMERREDGWTARLCDVEYVRSDPEGVETEIRRIHAILGKERETFDDARERTARQLRSAG